MMPDQGETRNPAIITEYRGNRFRSRLEARWAALFDLLEIPYIYEPIDAGGYIPDFLLPGPRPTYVEVGPVWTTSEYQEKSRKGLIAGYEGGMRPGELLVVGTDPLCRGLTERSVSYHGLTIGLHWQNIGQEQEWDAEKGDWADPVLGTPTEAHLAAAIRYGAPATLVRCERGHGSEGGDGCRRGGIINTYQMFSKYPCGSYEGGGWSGEYMPETVERLWGEAGKATQWLGKAAR